MSFFGKNIKKIRSVKSLSQQAFAELFELKRGTLGAYEEERSEPKIETILKIANYFSISVDNLLTHELTVNELLRFKADLTTYADDVKHEQFPLIPCITEGNASKYALLFNKPKFIDELPVIQLPIDPEKEFRAFTVSNLEMTNQDIGFYPKDIVVGEKVALSAISKMDSGTLVFIVIDKALLFRRLYITQNTATLHADHKGIEDISFEISKIKELWQVRYSFFKRIPELSNNIEEQMQIMQQELLKIKEKLG